MYHQICATFTYLFYWMCYITQISIDFTLKWCSTIQINLSVLLCSTLDRHPLWLLAPDMLFIKTHIALFGNMVAVSRYEGADVNVPYHIRKRKEQTSTIFNIHVCHTIPSSIFMIIYQWETLTKIRAVCRKRTIYEAMNSWSAGI